MAKAMRRKAASNLDPPGISSSSKSFLSFNTPRIAANLHSVGVSLGKNDKEVSVSTNALRHMEYDRLKVTPKVLGKSDTSLLDDEELHATVDGQLLKHLVGEVSEVDLDEATLRSVYDLKASGRKSKASSTKKSSFVGKRAMKSKPPVVSK
jgi:ribosomal protein L28